jgi:hypothetical protein
MRIHGKLSFAVLSIAAAVLSAQPASADAIYDVTVNTQSVQSTTVAAAFTLNPGGGPGNIATISMIGFGGGAAGTGCPLQQCSSNLGNASSDLTTTIGLDDSNGFSSQFVESFTAGSALTFQLDLTTNSDPNFFPDEFDFTLLDSSGNPLPGADALTGNYLSVQIDSANPTISTQQPDVTLGSPGSTVPEPATLALILIGGIPAIAAVRKKLR